MKTLTLEIDGLSISNPREESRTVNGAGGTVFGRADVAPLFEGSQLEPLALGILQSAGLPCAVTSQRTYETWPDDVELLTDLVRDLAAAAASSDWIGVQGSIGLPASAWPEERIAASEPEGGAS